LGVSFLHTEDEKVGASVKIGEVVTKSGLIVEYFCTPSGPSPEQCMDAVAKIAADTIVRNLLKENTTVISS
jgi:hypothetical protein